MRCVGTTEAGRGSQVAYGSSETMGNSLHTCGVQTGVYIPFDAGHCMLVPSRVEFVHHNSNSNKMSSRAPSSSLRGRIWGETIESFDYQKVLQERDDYDFIVVCRYDR